MCHVLSPHKRGTIVLVTSPDCGKINMFKTSLANYMAKLLWEWKPRFAVALVVRDLLIVTSPTNCDVTSGPVVMRCYANGDGDEQRYKTSKTQVSLTFSVNRDRGRIEIDHLYGLRCRGWYCNPEQHSLCRPQAAARRPAQLVLFRIAVPTTTAQTVSWSIPITIIGSDNVLSPGWRQAMIWNNTGILLIGPLATNLSEIVIKIQTFSFKKMHLNVSSAI